MDIAQQLIRDEGVKLRPYKDTVGKLSIGVGRNLEDVGVSIDEAKVMLQNDIKHATLALSQTFPWTDVIDDVRHAALVNLVFNMGIGGLSEFRKMLAELQIGNFSEAAAEMLNSKWATQVGDRAKRLALQVKTGQWQ